MFYENVTHMYMIISSNITESNSLQISKTTINGSIMVAYLFLKVCDESYKIWY